MAALAPATTAASLRAKEMKRGLLFRATLHPRLRASATVAEPEVEAGGQAPAPSSLQRPVESPCPPAPFIHPCQCVEGDFPPGNLGNRCRPLQLDAEVLPFANSFHTHHVG